MTIIPGRFTAEVAIVTGGASGMGRSQAICLAAEGAKVLIFDSDVSGGDTVCKAIAQAGGMAALFEVDLTRSEQIEAVIAEAVEEFGPSHLLFNNVGTILVKAYDATTEDEFDHFVDVDIRSACMVTRRIILLMVRNSGGSIVMMSSITPMRSFALEAVYGTTKSMVQALMPNVAAEYRQHNIRYAAICSAFVTTPQGVREIDEFKSLEVTLDDRALAKTQLRICEPKDVASVALYLASAEAGFLNGIALPVDNGWMATA